jgi:hypothetical protein
MIISSSRQFHYDKTTKVFSADISSFRINPISNIYDDAADAGIVMESGRTGKKARFVLEQERRDNDQDVTDWILKPTTDAVRQFPHLEGSKIILFND